MCKEALNIYDILWEVHKVIIYSILFHDAVSYCLMICNIAPECLLNTWRGTKTWKTLNMPASKAPAAHKAAQATSREGRLASPELCFKRSIQSIWHNATCWQKERCCWKRFESRALSIDILSWCPDVLHAKPILELHLVPLGGTCVEGASCHYSMEFCEIGGFAGLSSTSSAMLN